MSSPRLCVCLLILISFAAVAPMAAAGEHQTQSTEDGASTPPGPLDKVYDLIALRPFGLVQVATGSAFLLAAYLPALALGGGDDVVRVCFREPVSWTFTRPLGRR
jgi:hypothetical protein